MPEPEQNVAPPPGSVPAAGTSRDAVPFHWQVLVPNGITFAENILALAAIWFGCARHDRRAACLLLAAGVCDLLDGAVARKLHAQTRFGNIYDSMSDFLSFGIAPAAVLVAMSELHPAAAGVYVLAIQFRLTRFSARAEPAEPERFFRGLAAPDAVYVGLLLGMIPGSNFSLGYLAAAGLAVYPRQLWPKKFHLAKIGAAVLAVVLFVRAH